MTMKAPRSLSASEFKATCLEVLDRVARDRTSYVVTKRGRPVAKLVPLDVPKESSLRGSVKYHGDIVAPILGDWDVDA